MAGVNCQGSIDSSGPTINTNSAGAKNILIIISAAQWQWRLQNEGQALPPHLWMVQKGKIPWLVAWFEICFIGCMWMCMRCQMHIETRRHFLRQRHGFYCCVVLLSSNGNKMNSKRLYKICLYKFVAVLWGFSFIPVAKGHETQVLIHNLHTRLKSFFKTKAHYRNYGFPGVQITENYNINRKERSQVAYKNLHLLGDSQQVFS